MFDRSDRALRLLHGRLPLQGRQLQLRHDRARKGNKSSQSFSFINNIVEMSFQFRFVLRVLRPKLCPLNT
jgi:hypothetical protein